MYAAPLRAALGLLVAIISIAAPERRRSARRLDRTGSDQLPREGEPGPAGLEQRSSTATYGYG